MIVIVVTDWLAAVPDDKHKAQCRYCEVEVSAEINVLKKHANTVKHRQIMNFGT